MKARIFVGLLVAGASVSASGSPVQRLTITATTPKVAVAPMPAGRQYVELPDLQFLFLVEPRCGRGLEPSVVTLSIADSRRVLDGATLDEHGLSQTSLAVPASQLAPVPITNFCQRSVEIANGANPPVSTGGHRITAALSLHAALVCRGDGREEISYATRPLAISLLCELPPEPEQ